MMPTPITINELRERGTDARLAEILEMLIGEHLPRHAAVRMTRDEITALGYGPPRQRGEHGLTPDEKRKKFPCPHCGADKQTLNGLCQKCSRFSNIEPAAMPAIDTVARAFVQSWDQHIGADGAIAVLNALDSAGYKIVRKDMTEQMLERIKAQ